MAISLVIEKGNAMSTTFIPVRRALRDFLGTDATEALCDARAALTAKPPASRRALAGEPVDSYPASMQARLAGLLDRVGEPVAPGAGTTPRGAASAAFDAATRTDAAPRSAFGYYRVGEDGRLYLATKSEHYHAPLGHAFPGYGLLDRARRLGIPNATHNNTRGALARRLEETLIRAANGLGADDDAGLRDVLARRDDLFTLNRVINLETGSLAVEAAFKFCLARFMRIQDDAPAPVHAGRVPVFLVMGDQDGGLRGNYHGTTTLTQLLRGMWPGLAAALEEARLLKVVAIRPNCAGDLARAFAEYEKPPCKIAGFFHEIILMNYGAIVLDRAFLQDAYARCRAAGVPTVCDEIQSGIWAPRHFLFRDYGIRPSCVAVGKGFPGGEYAASRILFSAALDTLPQFGALVTNGQEELASLAYLVTMAWAEANAAVTAAVGDRYEAALRGLAAEFPGLIAGTHGWRHMTALRFADLERARRFTAELNRRGLDISAQTYKADCPPVALTKLPLIADDAVVARVTEAMRQAARAL